LFLSNKLTIVSRTAQARQRQKTKAEESSGFSQKRLAQAREVLAYSRTRRRHFIRRTILPRNGSCKFAGITALVVFAGLISFPLTRHPALGSVATSLLPSFRLRHA
jgi:hypothetical protein